MPHLPKLILETLAKDERVILAAEGSKVIAITDRAVHLATLPVGFAQAKVTTIPLPRVTGVDFQLPGPEFAGCLMLHERGEARKDPTLVTAVRDDLSVAFATKQAEEFRAIAQAIMGMCHCDSPREKGEPPLAHPESEPASTEKTPPPPPHSLDDYVIVPFHRARNPVRTRWIAFFSMVGILILLVILSTVIPLERATSTSATRSAPVPQPIASSGGDPQLWETGKDYVFWRAKILVCSRDGNQAKAERARDEMRRAEHYLFNTNWTQTQATEAIQKAEEHYRQRPVSSC